MKLSIKTALTIASIIVLTGCGAAKHAAPSNQKIALSEKIRSDHEGAKHDLYNARDKQDLNEAVIKLERVLAAKPQNSTAKLDLLYAYKRLNKFAEMKSLIKGFDQSKLSDKQQAWFTALSAKANDEFLAEQVAWQRVIKNEPNNRWALFELASIDYRIENYQAAINSIETALAIEPNPDRWSSTSIHYVHSKSAYRIGQLDKAITAAEPGLAYTATRRATHFRQTLALMKAGSLQDLDARLATYREYSKRNGKVDESSHQSNLAFLFFEHGDYPQAVKYAEKGFELNNGFYQAFILIYALAENDQAAEAATLGESMLKEHSNNPYLLAVHGWALYRLGKLEQAEQSLIQASKVAKRRNPAIERDLAVVQARIKNPSLAAAPKARWFGD